MPTANRPEKTRPNELGRDRIVWAAIELLDDDGESGLTFRALALRLGTGHGAIQWHVADKAELMVAATVAILSRVLATPDESAQPREAIHDVALGVFDAIEAHPWLAPQLFSVPWQPAMVGLWEQLGRAVNKWGVAENGLFTAVSTLLSYIVGVGAQNAVNTRLGAADEDRAAFLDGVAGRWENSNLGASPVLGRLAAQLRLHDDRKEFLAGIDIILSGLAPTPR